MSLQIQHKTLSTDEFQGVFRRLSHHFKYALLRNPETTVLTRLPETLDPLVYHDGRLFGPHVELHWVCRDHINTILAYENEEVDPLLCESEVEDWEPRPGDYPLWGTYSAGGVWTETRLPRAQMYPVEGEPKQVCLSVCEYLDHGRVVFVRYVGVGPCPE